MGRWRDVEHHIFTPRLRSQRLSSLLSEASSTPGRLSPTTMSMVHEICIEPVILPSPTPAPPASTPKSQDEKKKGRPEPSESERRNPKIVSLQPAASSKREHGERGQQQDGRAKRRKPNVVLHLRKSGPEGQQPGAG